MSTCSVSIGGGGRTAKLCLCTIKFRMTAMMPLLLFFFCACTYWLVTRCRIIIVFRRIWSGPWRKLCRTRTYAELQVAVSNPKAYKTCHAVSYNGDLAKFNNSCAWTLLVYKLQYRIYCIQGDTPNMFRVLSNYNKYAFITIYNSHFRNF